jgi:hypothetical protein
MTPGFSALLSLRVLQALVAWPASLSRHYDAQNGRCAPGAERHDRLEPELEPLVVDILERRVKVVDEARDSERFMDVPGGETGGSVRFCNAWRSRDT